MSLQPQWVQKTCLFDLGFRQFGRLACSHGDFCRNLQVAHKNKNELFLMDLQDLRPLRGSEINGESNATTSALATSDEAVERSPRDKDISLLSICKSVLTVTFQGKGQRQSNVRFNSTRVCCVCQSATVPMLDTQPFRNRLLINLGKK